MDSFTFKLAASVGSRWSPNAMQHEIDKVLDVHWGPGDNAPGVITNARVSDDGKALYVTVERQVTHQIRLAQQGDVKAAYDLAREAVAYAIATYGPLSPQASEAYEAFADAATALNEAEAAEEHHVGASVTMSTPIPQTQGHELRAVVCDPYNDRRRVVVVQADSPIALSDGLIRQAKEATEHIRGAIKFLSEHRFTIGVPFEGVGEVTYRIVGRDGDMHLAELVVNMPHIHTCPPDLNPDAAQ